MDSPPGRPAGPAPDTSSRLRKTSAETLSGSRSVAVLVRARAGEVVAARAHLGDPLGLRRDRPACRRRSRRRGRPSARPGRSGRRPRRPPSIWKLGTCGRAACRPRAGSAAAARPARRPPSPRPRRRRSGSRRARHSSAPRPARPGRRSAGSRSLSGSTPACLLEVLRQGPERSRQSLGARSRRRQRLVDRGPEFADPDVAERAGPASSARPGSNCGQARRTRSGSSARASGRGR